MDGTLTDSMWIWPEVDRIFLKKYHLTPPPGFAKALEGKSYTETATVFSGCISRALLFAGRCAKGVDRYDTASVSDPSGAKAGGEKEFLEFLKQEQILMGIATSNAKELALAALDALQIREYFSSVRTGCEVKKGKPAPDVYLKVAEDLGVQPEECLVFEDVPKGIEAGRNAGMTVCAVMMHSRQVMKKRKKKRRTILSAVMMRSKQKHMKDVEYNT